MDERLYWLGFSVFPGIGPHKFSLLLQRFDSAKAAWEASEGDLVRVLGVALCAKFEKFRSEFSIASYEKKLQDKNVSFLTLQEPYYPKLLAQIKNPPFVLYAKGAVTSLTSPALNIHQAIAVVGTRKITQYGREVTELFTRDLASNGLTIVSGLAMGVDAVAHQAALDANGKTIAVLGCGVDCCSPVENQYLYDQILEKEGVIISELPLGHSPTKGSFPARNRIIAGLSQAVLVTEGAEDSGALITADYAIKYGRPVFAVPGPITSLLSKGPYKLIQKGAKLVTEVKDIVKELGIERKATGDKQHVTRLKGETKEEQQILDLLQNEPLHFDEIVRKMKLDSAKVGTILSLMEMKGIAKSDSSGVFYIDSN